VQHFAASAQGRGGQGQRALLLLWQGIENNFLKFASNHQTILCLHNDQNRAIFAP
jgi:hypothetical protein